MKARLILGFDIGGTKSTVLLGTVDGEIIDRTSGVTELTDGPLATIDRMISDSRVLIERNGVEFEDIAGVGIACGGPLDPKTGVILAPPNLPGWDEVPIVDIVQKQMGLPAALENDADCCALAEFFFGAGKNKKNVVSFTWGTGIGSGMVLNGKLFSGARGCAGEIGHVTYKDNGRLCGCGKRGCIEAHGSGSSMVRIAIEELESGRVSTLSTVDQVDGKAICDAARAGDGLALEVLNGAARAMGRAVSIAAQILNPEVITLGTMAHKAPDLLMPIVHSVVEEEVWPGNRQGLVVIPSPLGDGIQDLSAIAAYMGRMN